VRKKEVDLRHAKNSQKALWFEAGRNHSVAGNLFEKEFPPTVEALILVDSSGITGDSQTALRPEPTTSPHCNLLGWARACSICSGSSCWISGDRKI